MRIVAEIRESIAPAIPQVINLLSDWAWKVCKEAVNALTILYYCTISFNSALA